MRPLSPAYKVIRRAPGWYAHADLFVASIENVTLRCHLAKMAGGLRLSRHEANQALFLATRLEREEADRQLADFERMAREVLDISRVMMELIDRRRGEGNIGRHLFPPEGHSEGAAKEEAP